MPACEAWLAFWQPERSDATRAGVLAGASSASRLGAAVRRRAACATDLNAWYPPAPETRRPRLLNLLTPMHETGTIDRPWLAQPPWKAMRRRHKRVLLRSTRVAPASAAPVLHHLFLAFLAMYAGSSMPETSDNLPRTAIGVQGSNV